MTGLQINCMDHRHSSCSCYQVCWPNLLGKSISELSNRCLGVDCSQICKKEAHQAFLSCDPSSWKGAYKSAWGTGRKRPHYFDSQVWLSTGWTCIAWRGSWRLQKALGALVLCRGRQQLCSNTCLSPRESRIWAVPVGRTVGAWQEKWHSVSTGISGDYLWMWQWPGCASIEFLHPAGNLLDSYL